MPGPETQKRESRSRKMLGELWEKQVLSWEPFGSQCKAEQDLRGLVHECPAGVVLSEFPEAQHASG